MTKPKKKTKRPHPNSAFKTRYVDEARRLADLGLLDEEMAKFFRVHERTITRWKGRFPEFAKACLIGGTPANTRVQGSLYKRANGFEVDAEEIKVIEGKVVRVPVKRYFPPDTIAMIFWLKCKAGWNERELPAPEMPSEIPHTTIEHEPQPITRDIARRLLYAMALLGKAA